MHVGAQLYTVRDFCKTLADFEETLKKVVDIGYRYVQVSGTCAFEPAWLRDRLEQNGLRCVLTHVPPDRIAEDTRAVISDHDVFGCDNIGIGYYEVHREGVEAFHDRFGKAAARIAEAGKRLCYHNHDQEFRKSEGRTVLELLAERFSPELLCFTPDTYWIQAGGGDPAWWIRRLQGRAPCVHLKDMAYGRKMAALGEGNLNLDAVLAACEDAGTDHLLVEQDDCDGQDPFACLKTSYDFLRSRGFDND